MNNQEILNFLSIAEKLKGVTRHSWTSNNTHESVASHSWQMALMALLMKDDFKEIDMNHVIELCLVHDLGEAITTDIPAFLKTNKHEAVEVDAQVELVNLLTEERKADLKKLFDEMNEMQTPEARLYKCLDKCEALIQHNEASIDTWLDLEYDLQLTYGINECEAFPQMKAFREKINQDSLDKIEKEGKRFRPLVSDRLILRQWTQEDAADLFEYAAQERVAKWCGYVEHPDIETSKQVINMFNENGCECAIVCKENRKVIGGIGFKSIESEEKRIREIGYCVNPEYWGKGYATEAVATIMDYCFNQLQVDELWCNYYEGNERSKRVIEKSGFEYQHSNQKIVELRNEKQLLHCSRLTKAQYQK